MSVAELYDREGNIVRSVRLSEVVAAQYRGKVEQLEKYFKWLEGMLGRPLEGQLYRAGRFPSE